MIARRSWRQRLVLIVYGARSWRPSSAGAGPRSWVLAADPETGEGRVTVATAAGQVELPRGASTTVVAGNAPAPPSLMSDAEIQQLFGAALAVQPPPARRFELHETVATP
jgi:hypothetical protein